MDSNIQSAEEEQGRGEGAINALYCRLNEKFPIRSYLICKIVNVKNHISKRDYMYWLIRIHTVVFEHTKFLGNFIV